MRSRLWQLWQAVTATHIKAAPLYQHGSKSTLRINNMTSCLFIFSAFLFVVPLIVFISTVIGAVAAAASAAATSREREANRFDLLATTPAGVMGASWLLGLGAVHHRNTYRRLQSWYTWLFRGAFIFLGYLVFEVMLIANNAFSPWQVIVVLVGVLMAILGFYIDHMQSLTLGVLVGMMTPTYANDRIGAEVGAVLFYLLLRVSTLAMAFVVMFGVLAPIAGMLPPSVFIGIVLRVLQLVVFAVVNEAVVRSVWRVLVKRMENDLDTRQQLLLPVPLS